MNSEPVCLPDPALTRISGKERHPMWKDKSHSSHSKTTSHMPKGGLAACVLAIKPYSNLVRSQDQMEKAPCSIRPFSRLIFVQPLERNAYALQISSDCRLRPGYVVPLRLLTFRRKTLSCRPRSFPSSPTAGNTFLVRALLVYQLICHIGMQPRLRMGQMSRYIAFPALNDPGCCATITIARLQTSSFCP